jgi:heme-degrading monooxygenase HmoA
MIDINKKPSSSLNKNKYKSTIGFTDLLFNLLVGFVYLFIIAFILINPIQKKQDVPKKAEFMVVIEWPSKFNDDIDLWVKSPDGKTVSFVKKEAGIMNLEKDDLGVANDSTVDEYGQRKVIYINREVITIRGILAGQYQVAAHVYSMRPKNGSNAEIPQVIKFKLIKINPYKEHIILEKFYNVRGQVITLANFWVDKNGKFVKYNTIENNIVTRRNNGGGL